MKFITVRDLRSKSAQIWRELPDEQEMIITNNGRPVAILTSANEKCIESALKSIRRARLADAVSSLQKDSMKQGTDRLTQNEINQEIKESRRARKK